MKRISLRVRMMVLFTALAGGLLAGTCVVLYVMLEHILTLQFNQRLLGAAQPVVMEVMPDPEDLPNLDGPLDDDVRKLNLPGEYFELLTTGGQLLQQSANLRGEPLHFGAVPAQVSRPVFRTLHDGRHGVLGSVLIPFWRGPQRRLLLLAMSPADIDQALAAFRGMIGLLMPAALLITAAVSVGFVTRSLRPIADLTSHAAAMAQRAGESSADRLWTPLTVTPADDELGRLAATFNRLFERIDTVVGQLRQFVTDASHELRTPLTVLQGETELILSTPREAREYRASLESIDGELKKLSRIVQNLFTLSMADAGQLSIARQALYLNEVLEQACAMAAPRARAKGIVIDRLLNTEIPYSGDEAILRQLFLIFLDNAIKYSPPDTRVRAELAVRNGQPHVTFADQGFGIAEAHLPHIFERFYRASDAGPADGAGLGLAIAQALTHAHGGRIECSSAPGEGSTFTVCLPAQRPTEDKPKLILN